MLNQSKATLKTRFLERMSGIFDCQWDTKESKSSFPINKNDNLSLSSMSNVYLCFASDVTPTLSEKTKVKSG